MLNLSERQRDQLSQFQELAQHFNRRLNLYSPTSAEDFWQRHIVHSLALTPRSFPAGSRVVDWGTGGGLPGIPLAVAFPGVHFTLVDSVGKKVRAVQTMARRLELDNVETWIGRAEEWPGRASHSVSRATSPLDTLWEWHARVAARPELPESDEPAWPPGLICLKGGKLEPEIADLQARWPALHVERIPLKTLLLDPYFREKEIVGAFERRG